MDILVCESDESLRDLFAYILEKEGNRIFFASNLSESFNLLSYGNFRRIYVDLDSDEELAYLLVASAVYQRNESKLCCFHREVLTECLESISPNGKNLFQHLESGTEGENP